jgi:tetratricopeptide (TPR) repeat protein
VGGNFIAARDKFQAALDISPPEFKAKFNLNLNKAKAEIYNQEGLRLSSQGDYTNAIQKFNEALNILPTTETTRKTAIKDNLANTHNLYGENLMKSNVHEALKQFNLAISNASSYNQNMRKFINNKAEAYNQIGHEHFKKEEFEQAQENYEKAVELNPSNNEYKNNVQKAKDAIKNRMADNYNREGELFVY